MTALDQSIRLVIPEVSRRPQTLESFAHPTWETLRTSMPVGIIRLLGKSVCALSRFRPTKSATRHVAAQQSAF